MYRMMMILMVVDRVVLAAAVVSERDRCDPRGSGRRTPSFLVRECYRGRYAEPGC